MNRQIGVEDFKYVVVSDPLPLAHVIRRMRIHYVCSPAKVDEQRFRVFLDPNLCNVNNLICDQDIIRV